MKRLITFLISVISFTVYGQTVRLVDDGGDPVVSVGTTCSGVGTGALSCSTNNFDSSIVDTLTYFNIDMDSVDSSSFSAPFVAYAPLNDGCAEGSFTSPIYSSSCTPGVWSQTAQMTQSVYSSGGVILPTISTGVIRFTLYLSNPTSSEMEVRAQLHASETSKSALTSLKSVTIAANSEVSAVNFYLKTSEICAGCTEFDDGSSDQDTDLDTSSGGTTDNDDEVGGQRDFTLYLFLTSSSGGSSTVTPDDNGEFVKISMSNKVPTLESTLTEVRPGDGQILLSYTSDVGTMNEPSETLVFALNNTSGLSGKYHRYNASDVFNGTSPTEVASLSGNHTSSAILLDRMSFETSAENMKVDKLINNQSYILGIAHLDRWGFTSFLSPTEEMTPLSIIAPLEEQSCYFISAGFDPGHPILNLFRGIRDRILLKFPLGRDFVHWYYRSAPKHAMKLYKSPAARGLIRFFTYLSIIISALLALWGLKKLFGLAWKAQSVIKTKNLVIR